MFKSIVLYSVFSILHFCVLYFIFLCFVFYIFLSFVFYIFLSFVFYMFLRFVFHVFLSFVFYIFLSAILHEYPGRDPGGGERERGGKIVADHLHNTYHTPPSYNSHNTYNSYNTSHNTYHTPPPQIKLCPVFGQYLLWSFYILPNLANFIFIYQLKQKSGPSWGDLFDLLFSTWSVSLTSNSKHWQLLEQHCNHYQHHYPPSVWKFWKFGFTSLLLCVLSVTICHNTFVYLFCLFWKFFLHF